MLGDGVSGLRLRLRAPDGFAGAVVLFSLDQHTAIDGAARMTADGRITITFPSIRARFEGRAVGDRLVGVWRQGGATDLTLIKGEAGLTPTAPAALTTAGLAELRTGAGSPGLIAAAQASGHAPVLLADGVRAADAVAPVTTNDRWHIGSITKSMTATLAARLIDQGGADWDETVGAVLGAQIPDMHDGYRDLTLTHLFSHRSGISDAAHPFALMRFHGATEPVATQRLALARIALRPAPAAPAGARFEYSNFGYVVAGAMLEAKTGRPWEDLMRAALFEPLGMPGAGFGAPGTAGALDEPLGHSKALFGDRRTPHPLGARGIVDNPAVLGPAGAVHARASDMLAYLAAHRDRTAYLRPESWRRLHTPIFQGTYALGWERRGDALWHNGSNTLWYAEAMVGPRTVGFACANDGWLERSATPTHRALLGVMAAVP